MNRRQKLNKVMRWHLLKSRNIPDSQSRALHHQPGRAHKALLMSHKTIGQCYFAEQISPGMVHLQFRELTLLDDLVKVFFLEEVIKMLVMIKIDRPMC